LAAAEHAIVVQTIGHALVKRALVGSGTASKEQINRMVTQLLRLRRAPQPNDVSDALALAIVHLNASRRAVIPA